MREIIVAAMLDKLKQFITPYLAADSSCGTIKKNNMWVQNSRDVYQGMNFF